jgi:hypothetical protein
MHNCYKKRLLYSSRICLYIYQGDSQWADFREISFLIFFYKICWQITILVKVWQKQRRPIQKALTCDLCPCFLFMIETGCVLRKVRIVGEAESCESRVILNCPYPRSKDTYFKFPRSQISRGRSGVNPSAPSILSLSHYTSAGFRPASSPSSGGSDVYMWQFARIVRVNGLSVGHSVPLTVNCHVATQ